ncbi:hypothetical protein [Paenibacillus medicaginis]|uniref:Portal protein n=1 Tax=Paenibacillus medicaginis TaxID=1470560 RepID=A0ABV5BVC6_9BACL
MTETSSMNAKAADMETDRELSSINRATSAFADAFISKMFSDGIIKDVTMDQLLKYLSNPDNYIIDLQNIAHYYYITSGEVFQLFEMTKVLPSLNYKITAFDKSKNYEKNMDTCNRVLRKVKHKQLTRDIIAQVISTGTLTGIWIGDKKNPYPYIFDRPDKVFPAYRLNGEWLINVDLDWVVGLKESEQIALTANLSPYLTMDMVNEYKSDRTKDKQYISLPQDRTFCIRTHTLKRNQPFGINWSLTGLYDLQHKKKLKDLEKSIANKIISAIAVLTIGNKDNPEYANLKLNKDLKRKIHNGVKTALDKNQTQGVTVVSIPEFADIKFPEMKSDALDPKKFVSINQDVSSSYGIGSSMTNGTGANFASAKINLDIFYKKIAVLLEDMETDVYGKLFKLVLPSSVSDDFFLEYDKEPPLTLKEKIDILMKLHTQEGFSLKAVLDNISTVDFNEYIEQSIYEQETLKLQDKIKPYASAYISTGEENGGRPTNENPESESTIRSKTSNSNDTPEG